MPLSLVTVPCLQDNYAYLIHDRVSGATAVVDVPEDGPVFEALAQQGWRLSDILITHHHHDHVGGVEALRHATGARVWGAAADAHRLPPLDHALHPGDSVTLGTQTGRVIDVSGHSIGHIAYHFPDAALVFSGDSLMALGCGRLFEGTPGRMWDSLMRLNALPPETRVCSGHDYTRANAAFARTIEPDNEALRARIAQMERDRAEALPMAVVPLELEQATNPFLRAATESVRRALGIPDASDVEVFAEIRRRKDVF